MQSVCTPYYSQALRKQTYYSVMLLPIVLHLLLCEQGRREIIEKDSQLSPRSSVSTPPSKMQMRLLDTSIAIKLPPLIAFLTMVIVHPDPSLTMKILQLIFFTVVAATTNSRGVEAQIELPRQDDLKVKRHLLEKHHPAFKTFKGDMHAGLIPAVLDSAGSRSDDFSSYMFWMFQPDVDASAEVSSCSIHATMHTIKCHLITVSLTLHITLNMVDFSQ